MPKILIKRGTTSPGTSLDLGEFGFKYDTDELYIGKGVGSSPVRISTWKEYSSAYTVLAANTAETPSPIVLPTNTVLGRLSSGITSLTGANLWTIINGANTADVNINGHKIVNLGAPSADSDAVTKAYVDSLVSTGLTFHEAVLDKDVLDPSSLTPNAGDRYWIGGTGAGDWAGHDFQIAQWNGSSWDFEEVTDGDTAYVTDENIFYYYDADSNSLKKLSLGMGPHASTHYAGGSDPIDVANLADSGNNLLKNAFSTKGDVLVGTGAGAYVTLPVGSDGQVLVADSSQTAGVKWGDIASAFTGLTDTPGSYSGYGGYLVAVKSDESGLEFVDTIDGGTL